MPGAAHTDVVSREDDHASGGRARPPRARPPHGSDPVRVPDDIRELADDVAAYHRELRARARRQAAQHRRANAHPAVRWLLPSGAPPAPGFVVRERRFLLPLSVTAVALVLSMVVTALLTMLAPTGTSPRLSALPLASPSAADGTEGGLLPAVDVTGTSGATPVRGLRPAVVLLIPGGCDCTTVVDQIYQDAGAQGIALDAVTDTAPGTSPPPEVQSAQRMVAFSDPGGRLRARLGATGLTAVVVQADGVIFRLENGPTLVRDLASDLQRAFAGR